MWRKVGKSFVYVYIMGIYVYCVCIVHARLDLVARKGRNWERRLSRSQKHHPALQHNVNIVNIVSITLNIVILSTLSASQVSRLPGLKTFANFLIVPESVSEIWSRWKKLLVPVSENLVSRKKGLGISQNFGLTTQCTGVKLKSYIGVKFKFNSYTEDNLISETPILRFHLSRTPLQHPRTGGSPWT